MKLLLIVVKAERVERERTEKAACKWKIDDVVENVAPAESLKKLKVDDPIILEHQLERIEALEFPNECYDDILVEDDVETAQR